MKMRQNCDRRWQRIFPHNEAKERRAVIRYDESRGIRDYRERRKK
jgi:hypothetical protein